MVKLALALLVTLASCSYDAARLLPRADASPDTRVVPSDVAGNSRDAIVPDLGVRASDAYAADARAGDTFTGNTHTGDAFAGDDRTGITAAGDTGKASTESDLGSKWTDETTFVNGRAEGALSGYGSISLGAADSVSLPTCGEMPIGGLAPSMPPVTFNSTCRPSAITWSSETGLCMSGTIPGWSSNKSYSSYLLGWGIMIGVAAREPVQAIGVAYKTIAFSVTGADSNRLLAVVHLSGDDNNRTYCASVVSGTPIKLSSLNTECAFGSGTTLSEYDVRKIDKIGVEIPLSDDTITLTDFCLTEIDLGR